MKKTRKPGGGRKKLKPEYDAGKNLKEQMDAAVALYDSEMSLQAIGEELGLNPIKVRKLLITAGVYESEVAEKVQATFQEYRETQDYKTSILSTANTLKLSKASVTSYLPYRKGVYFPSTAEKGKISVGAERQRRYRAMKRWRDEPTEENFWGVVRAYAGVKFKTYSGLPFSYEIKKGRNGEYTKELWIDRREKSKSLAWSSVLLALKNIKGKVVEQPESSGRYPGSDLHLRNVLSVRFDRCAGRSEGEDGASEKPQKIGCYVQKCAVICAVTEDVNLSLEGWQPSY